MTTARVNILYKSFENVQCSWQEKRFKNAKKNTSCWNIFKYQSHPLMYWKNSNVTRLSQT